MPSFRHREYHSDHACMLARKLVEARGHQLETFVMIVSRNFQARCARCKEWVAVALNEAVAIQGSALAMDCEESDD
jgi:hypothetical protein